MKNLKSVRYLFLLCLLLTFTLSSCAQSEATSTEEKPLVVFVTGDHEYSSEATMPLLAAELEKNYGMRTIVLKSSPDHTSEENIPGLEALKEADLAVFFLRWRRLPADQVKYIEDYLKTGKPVVGFRPQPMPSTTRKAMRWKNGMLLAKWR